MKRTFHLSDDLQVHSVRIEASVGAETLDEARDLFEAELRARKHDIPAQGPGKDFEILNIKER